MLLEVTIKKIEEDCPFSNREIHFQIDKGECLWLRGPSGSGKTSIARHLTELGQLTGADVRVEWGGVKLEESKHLIGLLFQQGVLIDSLNLEENIALSCESSNQPHNKESILKQIKEVDLDSSDLFKMPGELSGGMLRRAALAQILAQQKKLIVLDEPFVGLDKTTIQDVVNVIKVLKDKGIAFILISHQEEYCSKIVTPGKEIKLTSRKPEKSKEHLRRTPHWSQIIRTALRIGDYLGISIPLILCAFFAAGLATSMLFAQMLKNTTAHSIIGELGNGHSTFLMKLFSSEIDKVASRYLPIVREKVYISSMTRGFVVELGPLLTGLLLAGRIGGSYAGEVGMMQATNQNYLLRTLGKNDRLWSLIPAGIAALIAAPILTILGTTVALVAGGWVGTWDQYNVVASFSAYWKAVIEKVFACEGSFISYLPFVNIYRSLGFMIVILVIAEICARYHKNLQPRDVPQAITWAVVIASLFIIILDWGFSQMIHFKKV